VLHAPTLQIVPVADDHALIEATRRVIANPPDDVVVTTAVGFCIVPAGTRECGGASCEVGKEAL